MKTLALILSLCASLEAATFDFGTDANPVTIGGITVTLTPGLFSDGWIDYDAFIGASGFWDLALGGSVDIQSPAGQASIAVTAFEDGWIYAPSSIAGTLISRTTNGVNALGAWVTSLYSVPTDGWVSFTSAPGRFGLIIDRVAVSIAEPTPQLSIASAPMVSVSWAGTGWTLMRSSADGWLPVATNSPALLPAIGSALFKLTK
jgi:hypothetical protein